MFGILLPDTTEVPFHWDFSSLFNFCVKFLCLESTIFISELKIKQKSKDFFSKIAYILLLDGLTTKYIK